uniref:Cytochrome c554 and c-prime n=1 Tax=Candidatus Kentrum sp. TUN TaxID=2126343 RepID=A0A450ZA29_9GAMM|nr:MAG: Cytochrome c554 and c-prime [Candidatus Kentron sp. TUN]
MFRVILILLLWLVSWHAWGADASPSDASSNQRFLDWFWERPLSELGTVHISSDLLNHSPLMPETCGLCHPQYTDWIGSRHAQAMGPGAIGQFFHMSREEIQACLDCHAPLSEQSDSLIRYLENAQWSESTDYPASVHTENNQLHQRGVTCAVCHIREDRWYGPPRRGEPLPAETMAKFPHGGWIPRDAFQDSRFCAACHQFPPDGFSLNGKLIENTYEEWRVSPQAHRGMSCQTCHMPDRRHLFQGIHDPETVRAGVDVGSKSFSISKGHVTVLVFLTNTGVGHRLPTYVTPEIRLEAYQQDTNGDRIPGTGQVEWIARKVNIDLTREHFDTRLSPGQTATLAYQKPLSPHANMLVTRVYVAPDAFYTRIYEALLDIELDGKGAVLIRKALMESKTSGFSIYEKNYPIKKNTRIDPPE